MRSVFVAILVSTSFLLAGCSDDKGHDDAYTCPDGTVLDLDDFEDHHNATFNPLTKCPKSATSTTSLAPNVLPVLSLKVTDDGGNVTPVTLLDGNLTFDATGSTDSDGQITGIAVSVTDSNTTRTATLYNPATKTFKSATFKFDRPGIVNVTVAMVDDRAGFTVNQSKVYVNHPQQLAQQTINLGPDPTGEVQRCGGTIHPILDANYYKPYSFTLGPGASFVEATVSAGNADIGICSPADELISDVGSTATTLPDAVLTPPAGVESYYVGATANAPSQPVSVFVVVHYEPRPAA